VDALGIGRGVPPWLKGKEMEAQADSLKAVPEFNIDEGRFALTFGSYEEMGRAKRIIEEWDSRLEMLQRCAYSSMQNGKALQRYGGENVVEGRIRETVAMAIDEHAVLLLMATRKGSIDAAWALLDQIEERTFELLWKENPEEYIDMLKACPPRDPAKVKADASKRLAEIKEYADSLDPEAPDFHYNMRAVDHDADLENRVMAIADEAQAEGQLEVDNKRDRLIAESEKAIVEIGEIMAGLTDDVPEHDFEWNIWNYHLENQKRIIERARRGQR